MNRIQASLVHSEVAMTLQKFFAPGTWPDGALDDELPTELCERIHALEQQNERLRKLVCHLLSRNELMRVRLDEFACFSRSDRQGAI